MEVALQKLDPLLDALRPHLTPILTSLPPPVRDFGLSLLGPECYPLVVERLDLSGSPACTKLAVSKALGVGIVSVSAVVKVPQLLKLLSSRSARGVSFTSYLLETLAYVITLAYNVRQGNPYSTFGEIAVLAVQNVMVAVLVLHFKGQGAAGAVFVAGLAATVYALFNPGVVGEQEMAYAQMATIPLALASKVPQIVTVAREKSTGQLSAFAVFNYLFGSLARVFTTLTEVDDPVILAGFVGGALLNFVLAAQMVWYWNSGSKLGASTPLKKKHYQAGKGAGGSAKGKRSRKA